MPSHLRLQSHFDPIAIDTTARPTSPLASSPLASPKPKMTLTQTYYVASTARSKLGREAARPDHNLRRLVGHANMLDQLMVELSQAEAEQEAWFNASVRTASKPQEPRHVQWIDTIAEADNEEEEEEDEFYDESDDESDFDDDELEAEMFNIPLRRIRSPPVSLHSYNDDMEIDELEVAVEEEQSSSTPSSPPELTFEDSDSEEELPSSPRNVSLELSDKERKEIAAFYNAEVDAHLAVQQQQQRQPLIAAC